MKIKWIPNWIKEISLVPFSLNFVIGPRQVGKTTGIKLLIKELLKEKNNFSVFYFDVEALQDPKEVIVLEEKDIPNFIIDLKS